MKLAPKQRVYVNKAYSDKFLSIIYLISTPLWGWNSQKKLCSSRNPYFQRLAAVGKPVGRDLTRVLFLQKQNGSTKFWESD